MAKEATSECCNMLPTCPLLVNDCVASVSSLPWGMSTARCWKKVCQIRFDVMHNHVNNAQQAALLQIAASATSRTHRVIRPSYLFHRSLGLAPGHNHQKNLGTRPSLKLGPVLAQRPRRLKRMHCWRKQLGLPFACPVCWSREAEVRVFFA